MINGYDLFLTITKIDNYQNNKSPADFSARLLFQTESQLLQLTQIVIVKGSVVIHRDKQAIFKRVI